MAAVARRKVTVAVVVLCAVVSLMSSSAKAQDTTFVSAACNTRNITAGSSFWTSLDHVLADLEENTAFSGYHYNTHKSEGNTTAYGLGICNQKLTQAQCTSCLTVLAKNIYGICNNSVGARVQLADCFIRYEEYGF